MMLSGKEYHHIAHVAFRFKSRLRAGRLDSAVDQATMAVN